MSPAANTPGEAPAARCARCGAPFECGAASGACWCAGLPPLAPRPGRACLCRACLERELEAQRAAAGGR